MSAQASLQQRACHNKSRGIRRDYVDHWVIFAYLRHATGRVAAFGLTFADLDLRYSPADEQFRQKLRAWLERAVPEHGPPPSSKDWRVRRAYDTSWQRKIFDGGYAGVSWPKEFGGLGAKPTAQLIYYEEIARAHAPPIGVNFVGLQHGGPTLIAEGTPEQKQRHLSAILRGDEVWCQGFSEPNAGSDLASLRTSAVRDGDHYVVNGQKVWTSFAEAADYCELLVRTDPSAPKHRGITWLILPMDLPGIEVRPLRTMLGESEFSEVFLDDVRVPVANRVGSQDDGWRIANVTLGFERGTALAGWIVELQELIGRLRVLAQRTHNGNSETERHLRHLEADLDALWALVKMTVSEANQSPTPAGGLAGSVVKLRYSELHQRTTELGLELLGRAALSRIDLDDLPCARLATEAMHSLALTIAAGTSQIQRNIIAEKILGLPKEATK